MTASSDDLHAKAMTSMDAAEALTRVGRLEAGREECERAAALEQQAADAVPEGKPRTRGILCVSAVSLWMRAGRLDEAAAAARRYLGGPLQPGFARELHSILADLERERLAVAGSAIATDEEAAGLLAHLKRLEERLATGDVELRRLPSAA